MQLRRSKTSRTPWRLNEYAETIRNVEQRGRYLVEERQAKPPFFSVCIPQYSRYPFLRQQLETLARQTYKNFEVCVSDNLSAEQEEAVWIIEFLKTSGLSFAYRLQTKSLRYDGNLRAAIDLAQGEFAVLMGNDDKFADRETLDLLHTRIVEHTPVSAVITNYKEIPSGRVFRRILRDGVVGSGVGVATRCYRNYAFVSGLVLRRSDAIHHRTEEWDGSEMYQMFLASRIVAAGGRLLGLERVAVLKDIQIAGLEVDSYKNRKVVRSQRLTERVLPLSQIPSLVYSAVAPFAPDGKRSRAAAQVLRQMLPLHLPLLDGRASTGQRIPLRLRSMPGDAPAQPDKEDDHNQSRALGYLLPLSVLQRCRAAIPNQALRQIEPPPARLGEAEDGPRGLSHRKPSAAARSHVRHSE